MAVKENYTFSVYLADIDVEYEVDIIAEWNPAEPDVGIFTPYIEEWTIQNISCDGESVPNDTGQDYSIWERLHKVIEAGIYIDNLEPPEQHCED